MSRKHRVIVIILCCYLGLHFGLSRYSAPLVEKELYVKKVYFYVPISPIVLAEKQQTLGVIHVVLKGLFYPVWQLDYLCTGMRPSYGFPLLIAPDTRTYSEKQP